MKKKISVIIPTYRRPELLSKCLNALLIQNLEKEDYEIIVVSDGPDEHTRRIVVQLTKNSGLDIRYFQLREKKGPAAARNMGWQMASSDLIAFTDDDCLPRNNWLSEIINAYISLKSPAVIAFTGKVKVPHPFPPTDYEWNTSRLESAEFVTANCATTRESLIRTGGFDERFGQAWREDSDLHFKLIQQQIPIYVLKRAVVVHPVRKAPWGVSVNEQKKSMFNPLLYKKFPSLYRERIQSGPVVRYYIIILFFFSLFLGLLAGSYLLAAIGLCGYLAFTLEFFLKRLKNTSKSFRHIVEMMTTSFIIPFASIYWTVYGAFKHKVFFL